MTMPHQMNCTHSGDGWCLDCVGDLWEEREKYRHEAEVWRKSEADTWARFVHIAAGGSQEYVRKVICED